ncbi:histidine--tRNA ligase [Blastopirellula sp. JC732]|uniref:Histidine--tRNA ligase n=1 Tax=Blastopirellula sediminis TaxID=2894196 RepID=A0A9X1MHJ7_9BACT|nr:histidine--tRNA ligase [Blastopirellula sediminis]MCC9604381.1 histidine--tRNA ligase [Blastopirellula sediminis]MCC9626901.1 histidine--tRNA ligase [Blastopirellula sediminis]
MIQPRTLKGFRDYLPEAMMPREGLIDAAKRVYRSYGFAPIDTPALEYAEVLTGKGSDETDRQMYRFEDHGGRDVGLRFDLTVPLARFAAQHVGVLGTPFKRYHIASVWRGENTQRGRYREFMQCDFDTIGTKSLVSDIETALVIHDLMRAIGFEGFQIRVNNRKVLSGVLEKLSLADRSTEVLRALDKLAKIGREKVAEEMMAAAGATAEQADQVLKLAEVAGSNTEILKQLEPLVAGSEKGEEGLAQLRDLLEATGAAGVTDARLAIDVSIARGLDYYTGTIFETFLDQLPGIGSVCSGGRYDNLASLYTKEQLPGVGASLGLDRLLAAMEELELIEKVSTPAPVFIPYFDEKSLGAYLKLAAQLRAAGIGVEVYPEAKKLGQQLKYADRRGFKIAIIAGDRELSEGKCQVKNLLGGDATDESLADNAAAVVARIQKILESL